MEPRVHSSYNFSLELFQPLCDKSLGFQFHLPPLHPPHVLRCQSDLFKQKPNYVTSPLKILKLFPMEAVFQTGIFSSKILPSNKSLNIKQKSSTAALDEVAMVSPPELSAFSDRTPWAPEPLGRTLQVREAQKEFPKGRYIQVVSRESVFRSLSFTWTLS